MKQLPLFTAIIHTFNRPALLKLSVEALRQQTYSNLEIILINNGAVPDVVEYLHEIASEDERIKLLHFAENQYSPEDPLKYVHVCWNAALAESTGKYVWIQQDDDILAVDYAEKMVALFQGNSDCTTAAGLPVSIDIDGHVNDQSNNESNRRPKYSDGKEVALDHLSGSGTMFSAPGTIFTIKRDVLLDAGGYHRAVEKSQIYGIVPFGTTGFDSTALFYWRHHEGQHNKQLTRSGNIGIADSLALMADWQLESRWTVYGSNTAHNMVRSYELGIYDDAARWFVTSLYGLKPVSAIRISLKVWSSKYFWAKVFTHALESKYYLQAVAPVLKPPLKRLFQMWPALAKLSPGLGRLSKKADRWT